MSRASNRETSLWGKVRYCLGGNAHQPRAASVKLYTSSGPKEMTVPEAGTLRRLFTTIVEMQPQRIETYDKRGRLLASLDMVDAAAKSDLTAQDDPSQLPVTPGSETTVHVTREERLLSHFANLLKQATTESQMMMRKAFDSLATIAQHHADRANALETRNASLQNALVKQTGTLLQSQLAVAQVQAQAKLDAAAASGGGEGDEADQAVLDLLRRAMGQGAGKPEGDGTQ